MRGAVPGKHVAVGSAERPLVPDLDRVSISLRQLAQEPVQRLDERVGIGRLAVGGRRELQDERAGVPREAPGEGLDQLGDEARRGQVVRVRVMPVEAGDALRRDGGRRLGAAREVVTELIRGDVYYWGSLMGGPSWDRCPSSSRMSSSWTITSRA